VRICMPSFPFTTYHFDKGEFGSTYGGTFLFDYSQYYYEDKFIVPGDVALGSIEYTEVEKVLLGPKMDEGEKYLVDCMLKQIKFKGSVNESTLKVR